MFNTYRNMKTKYRIDSNDDMYQKFTSSVVSCMFDWDEKIYQPILFDRMLRDAGCAALIKTDTAPYTPVWCYFTGGKRYNDGWFSHARCYDFIGNQYDFDDWLDNDNILVFFNTRLRDYDNFEAKFVTWLTDVDTSLQNNVHFSRMHPFPVARDKAMKARIDECMKSISEGTMNTVLVETILEDLVSGDGSIPVISLTDVEDSRFIQYLSHLHDSYISRFFFMLGLGIADNGKQAQITVDELNKNDAASITMPLSWYYARKDGFDAAEEKGHKFSFDFAEPWKSRIYGIINANKQEDTVRNDSKQEGSESTNDDTGSSDE